MVSYIRYIVIVCYYIDNRSLKQHKKYYKVVGLFLFTDDHPSKSHSNHLIDHLNLDIDWFRVVHPKQSNTFFFDSDYYDQSSF